MKVLQRQKGAARVLGRRAPKDFVAKISKEGKIPRGRRQKIKDRHEVLKKK
jgi:hypothetical protein